MERTVRNFRLLEQIGTGGMGVIYRAVQLTLDRQVALKEMHPHLAKDEEFLRRFEREAKTAATLQHENIVSVIDFGEDGGSYFLALEFVDGADLKVLLAKDPKVVLPVALAVMVDVLKGLEHAHARGIVHRDIKPANIMVTKDGVAKIADFSIAQAQTMPSMTVTGATLGTPAYMSPEQAAGGRPVDARTDLFSAGVILFEMLSGKRPFEGDTYASIISQLLTVTPPDLHEIDPVVPASITRVVKRALEKDPDRRYQSAADFRRDL
ncbi:MAG TPA: serine/threonine-protein kinase, partial [bacterium]|nr:serine/threonine-protein kinase [bacterium]